jgi:glycosyltransferase involved in cell wall biosynthesis
MSQKRICLYPDVLGKGGIGQINLNLAKGFLELGHEVDLLLNKKDERFANIPSGVNVVMGKGSTKASVGVLLAYLKERRPHGLIAAHNHINIISILAKKLTASPTKIIVTLHTALSRDDRSGNTLRKSTVARLLTFIYPHADKIVAVSKAVADDAALHLKLERERIQVVYNPVVGANILAAARETPQHPFFTSKTEPILLAIGRFTEQKDFPTLLRAFAELRKMKQARLVILGEGEERGKLEGLIAELGLRESISLPGFTSNPYAYLAASDLLVSSSAWEGLPTVIIESLALGTPIVATDCPGGTREILCDGQFGKLVPVADVKALAKAMCETLAEHPDKATLVQRSQDFSIQVAAQNYLALLS